ncbi:MAG: hypothetical protein PHE27_07790 [Alphaproteobacteria bacterium]|nr:hypothetical protein [Alphaproteobacteria bacterium]
MCEKKLAELLDPYRTMCLHFGWNIPYLLLTSAKEELLDLSAQRNSKS